MKAIVLVSCVLAVASAGYGPAPAHYGFHIPQINQNGVPVDTPEVQQARAAHLAALSDASSRAGPYTGEGQYQGDNGQYDQRRYEDVRYHGPHAYPTTQGIAHVTQDGVPLDTPEVAAAKANHFGLFSEALSRTAHQGPQYGAHYRKRRGIYGYAYPQHIPVIGPNGVPVDTPEVQHAKAAHFAAYAKAAGGYIAAPVYANAGFYGISHDGLPLDTPEVAHAKAAHFAAYNEAATRNGAGHAVYAGLYAGPLAYTHGAVVPVDTPEVQHAKAAHFAAHAAARAGHY